MSKGKWISSNAKQIIHDVYDYFENESKKCKGSALHKLGKKTSELLVTTSKLLNKSLQRREN